MEVLDSRGMVMKPFSRDKCLPVSADKTLQRIRWQNADDLSELAGKTVRFRFNLTQWTALRLLGESGTYGCQWRICGRRRPGFHGTNGYCRLSRAGAWPMRKD